MGVVGSLPSPPPPSQPTLNETTVYSSEESTQSSDECSYSIVLKSEIDDDANSPIYSNNINENQLNNNSTDLSGDTGLTLNYGPINIRVRRARVPTLATGRRSKFLKLEGDEAQKRELRRKRNREAAQKLKEKRNILEKQLEKQIQELEYKEQQLLVQIEHLELYKEELEGKNKYIISIQEKILQTTSTRLKHIKCNHKRLNQNMHFHCNNVTIKEELHSPSSPQWHSSFTI